MLSNNKKGFTLIEVMIVIGIIGTLAAIAVPQFLAYRIKSSNAKSIAQINLLKTAEVSLQTVIDCYGLTVAGVSLNGANGVSGPGALCSGPMTAATAAGNGLMISGTHPLSGNTTGMEYDLSTNTIMVANTSAANINNLSYQGIAFNNNGDTAYSINANTDSLIYWVKNSLWTKTGFIPVGGGVGAAFPAALLIPAVNDSGDEFNNAPGGGAPTGRWTAL